VAARWAKFLSIVGFVMCGLFAVAAIFAGSILNGLNYLNAPDSDTGYDKGAFTGIMGVFIGFIYFACAVLYFFPCLFLFRFATNMQMALRAEDQSILNTSFQNLTKLFRFVGILTIVLLSFYVLIILFVIIGLIAR